MKFNFNQKDLYQKYILNNNTLKELCSDFSCSRTTIKKYLVLYNIKKYGKIKILCKNCKKEFLIKKSRLKKVKYCSNLCKYKAYSINRKGKLFYNSKGIHNGMFGRKGTLNHLFGKKRLDVSLRMKKEKNWRWKGGITPLSDQIYSLNEYKVWRTEIFKRDNYTCTECGETNCYLEAHHIKRFSQLIQEFLQLYSQFSPIEDKETLLRLAITYEPFWNISNGKTLCKKCHKLTPNYMNKQVRKV
jgi:hypothetical protein